MALTVVQVRRRYQIVAEQVAGLIREGEFRSGDKLPPERDLVRQLGVSRPVVREAMIALEIAGLVEVRGGSGIYVRAQVPVALPDVGDAPFDVLTARRTLESEIAAVAAENAGQEDIAELAAACEQQRTDRVRPGEPSSANRRFHFALAAASRNAIYVKLLHVLWDELKGSGPIWEKLANRRSFRPTREQEHAAVLDAVKRHDATAARDAMRAHIDGMIRDYLDATADSEPPSPALPDPASGKQAAGRKGG
jgi:DNA-binding FadR family transcriptional regulator